MCRPTGRNMFRPGPAHMCAGRQCLPGLRAAAVGAVDRGRHERLEDEPAVAGVERLVEGRPALVEAADLGMHRWAVTVTARRRMCARCRGTPEMQP